MEIHWVGMTELDEAERAAVEGRLTKLSNGHSDLIGVRVTGRKSGHHVHGEQEVRITCQARGTEFVAHRMRPDLTRALFEAIDVFEREVKKLRERRRDRRRVRPEPFAPGTPVAEQV